VGERTLGVLGPWFVRLPWPGFGDIKIVITSVFRLVFEGWFPEMPARDVSQVSGDEHQCGEEKKGDKGREEDAVCEGGRHGNQELRLDFFFQKEGGKSEVSGE